MIQSITNFKSVIEIIHVEGWAWPWSWIWNACMEIEKMFRTICCTYVEWNLKQRHMGFLLCWFWINCGIETGKSWYELESWNKVSFQRNTFRTENISLSQLQWEWCETRMCNMYWNRKPMAKPCKPISKPCTMKAWLKFTSHKHVGVIR